MSNLLETIKSYLTPAFINQAAGMLGENETNVSKAVRGMEPVILAGLLNKDEKTMAAVLGLLSNEKNMDFLVNPGALLNNGNLAQNDPKDISGALLGHLFGNKVPAIINALAAFSGTKASSVSSLLGVVGPIVWGVLSKKVIGKGLNLSGLTNLLQSEENNIHGALPGGLMTVMGLTFGTYNKESDAVVATGNDWILPLLLLLALGGSIIYYMKNCTSKRDMPDITEIPAMYTDSADQKTVAAVSGFIKKLPSGFEIKGNATGIERQLVTFIEDDTKPVDKTTWFNFDRLLFKTGSAEIDMAESADQLNNMVEVLHAFPKVTIKIGGYTDNTGNEPDNLKLSNARASAVAAYIMGKGINKTRITAEGYGAQHPVGDNSTAEGRAQNRRIAVRVTGK